MVNTHEILDTIEDFQRRFVYFHDERYFTATTLWVAHTWAFEAAACTPYLYANSAEKRCGKTRLMEVLASMSRNPIMAGDATGPALFQHIDPQNLADDEVQITPTLFIDEVDTIWTGGQSAEDMRNVLNTGYKSNGFALRATGKFSTFAPKMLAGIDNGAMPDTIRDRSIILNLKRKSEDVALERWHERRHAPEADRIATALMEWGDEVAQPLEEIWPDVITEISDRAFDIVEPLLAIAELAGAAWKARARNDLAGLLEPETEPLSPGARCLIAAREIMDRDGSNVVHSRELAEATGIPAKAISNLLRPYDITPSTHRKNGVAAKGYRRDNFFDAWQRYL